MEAKKEEFDANNKERFTCGCGGCYTKHNKLAHEKANMHKEYVQQQTQII